MGSKIVMSKRNQGQKCISCIIPFYESMQQERLVFARAQGGRRWTEECRRELFEVMEMFYINSVNQTMKGNYAPKNTSILHDFIYIILSSKLGEANA